MEKAENNINFGRLSFLNELSYRPHLGLILKSCVCSLKWAQVELNCSIRWGDISFRRWCYFQSNGKYPYNFFGLYLLNKLSNWAQLGLILKSCVCSLKWAQVEVNCSILLGDISSQSCKGLCHFSENYINFGRLLLLDELSKWSELGLILKSFVCSLKWAQVEVICSIRSGDISLRSYLILWKLLHVACTYNP